MLIRGDNIQKSNYHFAIIAYCESLLGLIWLELGNLDQARLSMQQQPDHSQ